MPQFNITLSQRFVDQLILIVQNHNDQNGTTLTVLQWVTLHMKEVAISAQFAQRVQEIDERAKSDAVASIQAERSRLLNT